MFASKLVQYLTNREAIGETGLLCVLSKITLLSSIAACSLIATWVIVLVSIDKSTAYTMKADTFEIILTICFGVSTWINFGCVFLMFQSFRKVYLRLCGCADRGCLLLCNKIIRASKARQETLRNMVELTNNYNINMEAATPTTTIVSGCAETAIFAE